MGLFSFLGGIFGANAAKKASHKAETAQLGYLNQALGEEHREFDLTRSDFAPWRTEGGAALAQQSDLLGLHGGGVQQSAIDALHASPLFQSLFRNGMEANLQNASATGGIRGGNEARSLADFGSDTLAQVIQQQLGNLGGISGQGLAATGSTANSGDQITNAIAQILGNQGQVRAGGILTRGGINSSIWNNAGSFLEGGGSGGGGLGAILSKIPGLGPLAGLF